MGHSASVAITIIAFLFTDIEGSTCLWEEAPTTMRPALGRHDALLREAIEHHGGHVFKTIGDAFCAAFENVAQAVQAALAAQRALQSEVSLLRCAWRCISEKPKPAAAITSGRH